MEQEEQTKKQKECVFPPRENAGRKKGLLAVYKAVAFYFLVIVLVQFIVQTVLFGYLQKRFLNFNAFWFNAGNLVIVLIAVLIMGYRFYRQLRTIGQAVEELSKGNPVQLSEEGIGETIAGSINRTSEILRKQRSTLDRRDTARLDWIRGISHDIRTPLSMVLGYAELLEEDASLDEEQRRCAVIIREQSIKIKELLEDLNLTSKLESNRQPLRLAKLSPAELLREAAAAAINSQNMEVYGHVPKKEEGGDFPDKYRIELLILPEFEGLELMGDRNLLRRVFDNLIGNAIRHNPDGCSIMVLAYKTREQALIEIRDDGVGIPEAVARLVNAMDSEFLSEEEAPDGERTEEQFPDGPHIMGMKIAKQIMLTHGGNLMVGADRHTVKVILRL